MKRPTDLAGRRFGRLTAISLSHTDLSGAWWLCACACGKKTTIRAHSLKAGNTQSCGCKRIESSKARAFGGKRGMHTRLVLEQVFAAPAAPEVDRSEKTWAGAEDASATLAAIWGLRA